MVLAISALQRHQPAFPVDLVVVVNTGAPVVLARLVKVMRAVQVQPAFMPVAVAVVVQARLAEMARQQ